MFDFVIIGGGIAGASAAARLAPLGQVLLLEAETQLAYHASGRSAAMFLESYGNATVRRLNEASAPYLATAHGGVLTPRPLMLLGAAEQEAGFHAQAAEMGLAQIPLAQAAGLWPLLNRAHATHAALRDDTSDVDTDLLLQNFLRDARAHGAMIETGARVCAIARTKGGWQLQIAGKEAPHMARVVVNAAGAWADGVAEMAGVAPLGIQPYRRSMARIALAPGTDTRAWPFVDGWGITGMPSPTRARCWCRPARKTRCRPMMPGPMIPFWPRGWPAISRFPPCRSPV